MRGRVASVNGALDIESKRGVGTQLTIEIPSPEPATRNQRRAGIEKGQGGTDAEGRPFFMGPLSLWGSFFITQRGYHERYSRPSRVSASGKVLCFWNFPGRRRCTTSPRACSSSAISALWQRHQSVSEHMEHRSRLRQRRCERPLPPLSAHSGGIAAKRGDAKAAEDILARLASEATAKLNRMPIGDLTLLEHDKKELPG